MQTFTLADAQSYGDATCLLQVSLQQILGLIMTLTVTYSSQHAAEHEQTVKKQPYRLIINTKFWLNCRQHTSAAEQGFLNRKP